MTTDLRSVIADATVVSVGQHTSDATIPIHDPRTRTLPDGCPGGST